MQLDSLFLTIEEELVQKKDKKKKKSKGKKKKHAKKDAPEDKTNLLLETEERHML